ALDVYHAAGLRSLGPVWSRPTLFAEGVPFAFPASPDTGPGLTPHGRALVKRCNELRIMIDLSHMNEKGFWDVAALSDAPLVATHSNVHAICPSPRNLTDEQLEAVRASGGVVGLNFATGFLDEGGSREPDLPLEVMVRHVDHLVDKLGPDGVALGSDFDGAGISDEIGDVTGVQRLLEALRAAGYDQATLEKIAYGNWLSVLERTWGN
ncbi:MAG: membrane dipeptidase, partial [Trueperaceae bacterium]